MCNKVLIYHLLRHHSAHKSQPSAHVPASMYKTLSVVVCMPPALQLVITLCYLISLHEPTLLACLADQPSAPELKFGRAIDHMAIAWTLDKIHTSPVRTREKTEEGAERGGSRKGREQKGEGAESRGSREQRKQRTERAESREQRA